MFKKCNANDEKFTITNNIDNYSKIGYKHKVCQDYITLGVDPMPYVILSDGCSGSENSDIGARLLAHHAKCALSKYQSLLRSAISTVSVQEKMYKDIGEYIIEVAHISSSNLGLKDHCLDATLLISFQLWGQIFTYIYGDGTIILKYTDGTIGYIDISYPDLKNRQTAPYYLSYLLSEDRRKDYRQSFPDYKIYRNVNISKGVVEEKVMCYYEPIIFTTSPDVATISIISSDGLKSLIDINSRNKIELNEVVSNLLDFKSLKGEFIRKRMKKYIKTVPSTVVNYDDLSVGGFYIKNINE